MSDELKVCPFCGGDARIHSKVLAEGFDSGYWAVCDECGKGCRSRLERPRRRRRRAARHGRPRRAGMAGGAGVQTRRVRMGPRTMHVGMPLHRLWR